jgi:PKD repeat protein
LEIVHKADVMHSTQVFIDSPRSAFLRRAARLAWLPLFAAVTVAGCTKKTETPAPIGPSELGLSVIVTASPDVLDLDGLSQSQITITTRGPDGSPVRDVPFTLDMLVETPQGLEIVDHGRLSTKQPVTGSDGRAVLTYTAPAAATSGNSDQMGRVIISAVPVGTDYKNAVERTVDIRLRPRGVILPAPGYPLANFTISPTDPGEDQDIRFDGASSIPSCFAIDDKGDCTQRGSGSIVSYLWEFGNGRTGSGASSHTFYSTRGTYTAKLIVTNDRGLSNSIAKTITISGVANPTAAFTLSPTSVGVGERVNVDAAASQPAPGGDRFLIKYDWTWGDNRTSEGVRQSHTYSQAGEYTITLTVTDNTGRTGSATKQVTVGQGQQPVANFTFSPTAPRVGTLLSFDATVSTAPPGRTVARHEWNFGDNSPVLSGVEPRPTHSYGAAGTYVVTLTVIDSAGVRSVAVPKNVVVTP